MRESEEGIGGIFRGCLKGEKSFSGRHFGAISYCVRTGGLDEEMIRSYIKNQKRKEKCQEQMRQEWLCGWLLI